MAYLPINSPNSSQEFCRNTLAETSPLLKIPKEWLKASKERPSIIVSFDVSELYTYIPVPVALEVKNRKITTHISQGLQAFLEHSHSIPNDKIIALLELLLNNCVF